MKQITLLIVLLLAICGLTNCKQSQTKERSITVTIEPQRYFAEKIAGDKFKIISMVKAGSNPESYDPSPQQMVSLGDSEAYFKIGYIGFEMAWMENLIQNNPHLKVFDLSNGFELIESDAHANCGVAGHNHAADHSHGAIDPHIWSSVLGAKTISSNILKALISLDPSNEAYYTANYNQLMQEIAVTEQALVKKLDALPSRTFIIYHPALTYLAEEFNLSQLCIEMDGKEPSPALLKELIETAQANQTKVVFIQEEFDQKNAELIAKETGCQLVQINPLSYNWHDELLRIADALHANQP
jgi:zinc transport system substrate-binding protein